MTITKDGEPFYEFKDVKVITSPKPNNRKWIIFIVQKIEEEAFFDLQDLIQESGIKTVSGRNDQERKEMAEYSLWQYLINNGLFPYPVQIY